MITLTESAIFALMIFLPLLVAERIDAELREPEFGQVCGCDRSPGGVLRYAAQSLHPAGPTGDGMVVAVDNDFREQEGDLTSSATK